MTRIGIFGGTFDPPHNGHLVVANDAHHDLELDHLLMVVAKEPWQKSDLITPARTRYEMCVLATMDEPHIEVSRIEMDRDGPTYTIDTVRELLLPGDELILIVGQDQRANMSSWKEIEEILGSVILHVYDRWVGISSTEIRRRVLHGMPIRHIVPDAVIGYIHAEGLYGHSYIGP